MCGKLEKSIAVERMSRGQSQRRTDAQKNVLERFKLKVKRNDVIDIDSDRISDYIIIDPPDPSKSKYGGSRISRRGKAQVVANIIFIDDDENGRSGYLYNDFEESGPEDPPSTSSGQQPASHHSHKSFPEFSYLNKCQTAYNMEKRSSSNSLKHQSSTSRNWSSLHQQTATYRCENDDSDCDIVEDHCGNIREQWEKASLRKKTFENNQKGQTGSGVEFSAMGFKTDFKNDFGAQKAEAPGSYADNQNVEKAEAPVWSSLSKANHGEENLRSSIGTDEVGIASNKSGDECHRLEWEPAIQQEIFQDTSVHETLAVNDMSSQCKCNAQSEVELSAIIQLPNGEVPSNVQSCVLGERELLKKTDPYKQAEEDEWASRKRELQIQAEEAQRLCKRKKAKTLRLLEMERRQKQRLVEVREAQKKDEETLNLKEQLRMGIRAELGKLETNCRDMASLLRGLGIDVAGGLIPSSAEVRVAYKQALLRFHPDRASRNDIRQQIEAEEKFKLISRTKERFKF